MKFIIMVWLAFFARASPVSTIANPACMNMTRKPVTSVQTKLVAMRFWPTALTTSWTVRPFLGSLTGMSAAVPVSVPAGSPAAFSSGFGVGVSLTSLSVMGMADEAAAGSMVVCAQACPAPSGHPSATAKTSRMLLMVILPSTLPNRVLPIDRVDQAQDAAQTDRDPDEHDDEPHAVRRRQTDAAGGNQKSCKRDQKSRENHKSLLWNRRTRRRLMPAARARARARLGNAESVRTIAAGLAAVRSTPERTDSH